MGYYVILTSSTFGIPNNKLDEAYQRLCKLNERDDLKTGGSYSGGVQTARWFSWMDANYPKTCPDAEAIFEALGFTTQHNDTGLFLTYYDSKTGAEQLFLDTVSDLAFADSRMEWLGEDGERWEWSPQYGVRQGTVTYGSPVGVDPVQDVKVTPDIGAMIRRVAEQAYDAGFSRGQSR